MRADRGHHVPVHAGGARLVALRELARRGARRAPRARDARRAARAGPGLHGHRHRARRGRHASPRVPRPHACVRYYIFAHWVRLDVDFVLIYE